MTNNHNKQTKQLEVNKTNKDNKLNNELTTIKSKTKSGINKSTSKSKSKARDNNHIKANDTHTNKEAKSNPSTKAKNKNQHHKQALKRLKHREKIACRVLAIMCALIIGYCCFDAYITRDNNPTPQEIVKQEKASQHGYGYTLSSKPKHKSKESKARNKDTTKSELNNDVNTSKTQQGSKNTQQDQPTNHFINRANN